MERKRLDIKERGRKAHMPCPKFIWGGGGREDPCSNVAGIYHSAVSSPMKLNLWVGMQMQIVGIRITDQLREDWRDKGSIEEAHW